MFCTMRNVLLLKIYLHVGAGGGGGEKTGVPGDLYFDTNTVRTVD